MGWKSPFGQHRHQSQLFSQFQAPLVNEETMNRVGVWHVVSQVYCMTLASHCLMLWSQTEMVVKRGTHIQKLWLTGLSATV